MSPLIISLGAGALIGLVYSLLKVRSPAPPAVALVGLLGMVIGSTLGGKLLNNVPIARAPSGLHIQAVTEKSPVSPSLIAKQAG
ncbi:XapX domain-containing protein [Erwinia persicina]|mgnify:CR=1 FL=1|uniref:DUF1427 family protein n=2 Tax=Erwinia TaxID=551 RepID=A0ABV4EEQ4_9GAMM|nr:DUF1427 family protein [Erwinia sp. BC051422]MCP1440837.1 XapX domain-containing protein [Erwinia persicina]MDN8543884.1 DUF1427 family protein [Erwinia sp. BC051422]